MMFNEFAVTPMWVAFPVDHGRDCDTAAVVSHNRRHSTPVRQRSAVPPLARPADRRRPVSHSTVPPPTIIQNN